MFSLLVFRTNMAIPISVHSLFIPVSVRLELLAQSCTNLPYFLQPRLRRENSEQRNGTQVPTQGPRFWPYLGTVPAPDWQDITARLRSIKHPCLGEGHSLKQLYARKGLHLGLFIEKPLPGYKGSKDRQTVLVGASKSWLDVEAPFSSVIPQILGLWEPCGICPARPL